MTAIRLIARPMLASAFFVGAAGALKNAPTLAPKASRVTERLVPLAQRAVPGAPVPTDPVTLVRINAGVQLVAATALATGRMPRLSSTVLAASLLPTTVAGHAFWRETDPVAKKTQRLNFFKGISLVGGLLIAGVDTEGKPGVAWRARRAARDVRREAKQLARQARSEARLAKAHLT
ncbi:MAG: DoxX family protein [Nocardioides sp.]